VTLSEFHESTIIHTAASFGFHAFACSPAAITVGLGIAPDETWAKGDKRTLGSGHELVVHHSSWSIVSRSLSKDINEHVRELLVRLQSANRPFDPSWGAPAFGVLWKGNYLYAGSGPFYEADVLAGIAALGAALYQDIYQVDQPDDATGSQFSRVPKQHFGRR
jgi:hypothetical protein